METKKNNIDIYVTKKKPENVTIHAFILGMNFGIMILLCGFSLWQDKIGKEAYIQWASDHWIDKSWYYWIFWIVGITVVVSLQLRNMYLEARGKKLVINSSLEDSDTK